MEPIPETVEALNELGQGEEAQPDLMAQLLRRAEAVLAIVPDCIGISVGSAKHDVVFTVVASSEEIAIMDGLQYLAGGPCVDGAEEGQVLELEQDDLMSEDRWRTFARGVAARGVASTLTLPILQDGIVVGSVNLYGGSGRAFTGHHEAIARIFDAWAPGAVTNADLGFSTRQKAEQAPRQLRDEHDIGIAVGVLVSEQGLEAATARERLDEAATRAGVTTVQLARELISARNEEHGDS